MTEASAEFHHMTSCRINRPRCISISWSSCQGQLLEASWRTPVRESVCMRGERGTGGIRYGHTPSPSAHWMRMRLFWPTNRLRGFSHDWKRRPHGMRWCCVGVMRFFLHAKRGAGLHHDSLALSLPIGRAGEGRNHRVWLRALFLAAPCNGRSVWGCATKRIPARWGFAEVTIGESSPTDQTGIILGDLGKPHLGKTLWLGLNLIAESDINVAHRLFLKAYYSYKTLPGLLMVFWQEMKAGLFGYHGQRLTRFSMFYSCFHRWSGSNLHLTLALSLPPPPFCILQIPTFRNHPWQPWELP